MEIDGLAETMVALAIVRDDSRFLVCLRESSDELNGLWEFPGGKLRADELPCEAAVRECFEETGLTVAALDSLPVVRWRYAHGAVRLHPILCRGVREEGFGVQGSGFRIGEVASKQGLSKKQNELRWVTLEELRGLAMPAANGELLNELERYQRSKDLGG